MDAKEVLIELLDEALDEYLSAGMPFDEAYEMASRYAERNLTDRLADMADAALATRKDPLHPMFRDHNCGFCGSGITPCREGNPSRCGNPIARNE